MTSPTTWQRFKAVVQSALNLPSKRRDQFLLENLPHEPGILNEAQLLLDNISRETTFLETEYRHRALRSLEDSARLFVPNDVVCERYVIMAFIARGGMGEVYEVYDRELRTKAALKTLLAEDSRSCRLLERFRHEILLARTVTHPNVCRIFDLGHHDDPVRGDVVFLTMELLEGETLASHIERCAPVPCDAARSLLQQMVAGLSAAHQLGVIHRDFKPGNVMVTPSDIGYRVKITDFGLAKSMATDSTAHTSQGKVIGTPDYMAPEQFRGQSSKETDIYALGLTTFQLLTGMLPISQTNPFQTTTLESVKRIPAQWQRAISKCLATDPTERFRNVDDFWKALSRNKAADLVARGVAQARKHPAIKASFFLALICIAIFVSRTYPFFRSRTNLPKQKNIAVLPFRNIGDNSSSQAFADGVVETLTSDLSQLERYHESLWVVPSSDSRNVSSLDDAYNNLHANLAITGSVQQGQNGIDLTANLVNTKEHKQLASRSIHVSPDKAGSLQSQLWEAVADMVDIEVDPKIISDITAGGTKSPAAYQFYEEGVGHLRQGDRKEASLAIQSLSKAIAIDPRYALAYANLGNAYATEYFLTKNDASLEKATENVRHAILLNDKLVDVHLTLGKIYLQSGQIDEALAEFRYALARDPSVVDAQYHIGDVFLAQGKTADAEAAYKATISKQPTYWLGYSGLGTLYYRLGKFRDAIKQFKAVVDYAPANAIGYQDLGAAYLAVADYKQAVEVLSKSVQLKDNASTWSNLGAAYMYLERYSDAVTAMKRAVDLNPHDHDYWRNLGDSYRQLPAHEADANSAYEKALQAAESQLQVNPKDTDAMGGIALYNAHLGRKVAAEGAITRALVLAPKDSDLLFTSALVYELVGNRDNALKATDQAFKAGYSLEEIEKEPELRHLRSDPRYQHWVHSVQVTKN